MENSFTKTCYCILIQCSVYIKLDLNSILVSSLEASKEHNYAFESYT